MNGSYKKLAVMTGTATALMLGAMYLNTYSLQHVFWSETRLYMALLMGAVMAFVMLLFMWRMFPNRRLNLGILGGSAVVFAASLYLVRSQSTISDVDYMQAMIPHHSIAIMTSQRARITDPRVRELADQIIDSQRREISEMKALIAELD